MSDRFVSKRKGERHGYGPSICIPSFHISFRCRLPFERNQKSLMVLFLIVFCLFVCSLFVFFFGFIFCFLSLRIMQEFDKFTSNVFYIDKYVIKNDNQETSIDARFKMF